MGIGWDLALRALAEHLSGAEDTDREAAMAWMLSPAGLDFMTRSSEIWGEANVAAGAPEAEARAATDRVTAIYTATPEDPPSQPDAQ